jgi:hypothetical protein
MEVSIANSNGTTKIWGTNCRTMKYIPNVTIGHTRIRGNSWSFGFAAEVSQGLHIIDKGHHTKGLTTKGF